MILARAWSAYLDVALDETDEDGTPILAIALALNPALRDRLSAAMQRVIPPGERNAR